LRATGSSIANTTNLDLARWWGITKLDVRKRGSRSRKREESKEPLHVDESEDDLRRVLSTKLM